MASANMLSVGSPAVTKVALGQNVAASGSGLGKSTFTGVCVPVSSSRVPRRSQRKVCMSAAKNEDNKASAPLKKGLAAGLLAATIATSSGPAYADLIPAEQQQRWGNIVQKANKAGKKAASIFEPARDNLNKDLKNPLVDATANKISQKPRASLGGNAGFNRSNVSFTEAPPLRFVGLDTKGTPADPETVKDDAIGGVTDPGSIPGRIQERAGTIASKLGNLKPDLPKILPGDKGLKDVAPDLVEGSSQKIPQRDAPSYRGSASPETNRTNVSFASAPTLRFVGLDTKGTPADPETVKDDAVGGVTDPASIPGRVQERASTIASKLGNLVPDFSGKPDTKGTPADPETVKDDAIGGVTDPGSIPGRVQDRAETIGSKLSNLLPNFGGKPDTKGTPADPETVKDDAVGGITDPASIPGRVKDRADTIASKVGNLKPDLPNPDNKRTADPNSQNIVDNLKAELPDLGRSNPKGLLGDATEEKIPQKKGGYAAGTGVSFYSSPPLVYVGLDTKGTPADPATVKDDVVGGVTDPASIPGRIQERAGTIASKLGNLKPDLPNPDTKRTADPESQNIVDNLKADLPDLGRSNPKGLLGDATDEKVPQKKAGYAAGTGVRFYSSPPLVYVGLDTKGTPADPETVKDDVVGGVTDPASIPGRVQERASTIASKLGNLVPDFGKPDTKGTPADPETVKDDAIGGITDPASIPGRVKDRANTVASKVGNATPDLPNAEPKKPVNYFGTGPNEDRRGTSGSVADLSFNTKGTPADPETVKDDAIGGITDPASIPGRIKQRAGTVASKLPNLPNADQILPGDKGVKDVAPDIVEGSSQKIQQRPRASFGTYRPGNGTNVAFTDAPILQFVGLDTKGTPADPETVKDDAIGGVTDPASIPGRIKQRADTVASKLPNLPNVDQVLPGDKGLKDVAPDIIEGSSQKIPQLPRANFGTYKPSTNRTNVSFSAAPALQFVGLDTKGTPADPETVKDDAIGGVTDPGSIPGRIQERAGTIASKLPSLPNIDQILPGDKGIKDVAPDIVEGSSQKIPQRDAPGLGPLSPDTNRSNTSFVNPPPLRFVGLFGGNTKGTPADPETVKDDAIGGVTDPGSIPGRIKDRADTIASKLPNLPNVDQILPGDKGIKDVAPDIVEGSSQKIPQLSAPGLGPQTPDTNRSNVSFTTTPLLQFVGLDTKGTPADPETVKDDAIGGVTDPGSIPGRIKERADTIASKLPNLPNVDQILPGDKGIKDVAPDIVEGSSQKIPQLNAPGLGGGPNLNRSNVSFTNTAALQFVADTKGTPADPETVKDDVVGGVTDPASIPGRIKERADTIASKLPNLPKPDEVLPGNKGVKDIAPDLVEGSSQKIPQRSAQS